MGRQTLTFLLVVSQLVQRQNVTAFVTFNNRPLVHHHGSLVPRKTTYSVTGVGKRPHRSRLRTRSFAVAPSLSLTATSSIPSVLLSPKFLYSALLALQFALQPLLTKRFTSKDMTKSTYVVTQDVIRVALCVVALSVSSTTTTTPNLHHQQWSCWTDWHWIVTTTLQTSAFPAILYMIQNYCSLTAYQLLSPFTYNTINQTKTISAAVWCFILLKQPQSNYQMVSLVVLVLAAILMEQKSWVRSANNTTPDTDPNAIREQETTTTNNSDVDVDNHDTSQEASLSNFRLAAIVKASSTTIGLIAIVTASMTSGLAGAWTQRVLQVHDINSLVLSAQLAALSATFMGSGLLLLDQSPDGKAIRTHGWWKGWTMTTWIPLLTNATGGILVGLVTKHAGVVNKGFALIVGLFLSGVCQNVWTQTPVSTPQWIGGALAAVSLWMHASFPPQAAAAVMR